MLLNAICGVDIRGKFLAFALFFPIFFCAQQEAAGDFMAPFKQPAQSGSPIETGDELARVDRLILSKTTPEDVRKQACKDMYRCIRPLNCVALQPIIFSLPQICPGSSLTFIALNPSIQRIDDGYLVLCRATDFRIRGKINPQAPGYTTRNFLLKYSKDLKLISQKEILDDLPRERYKGSPHIGQIDCRLIYDPLHPSKLAMTCSTCDTNPKNVCQISYCRLQEDEEAVHISRFVPLCGPDPERWEKNWLPFFKEGKLCAIYSCDPFVTYALNTKTGECIRDICYIPQYRFSDFRGSAPPIPFDEGYLILVHERYDRIYTHRFVYLNKDYRITKISKPFVFCHVGVEFSCGMTVDHEEKTLLITFGLEDQEAYLASVAIDTARSMLNDLSG
jgi:hypothetical protein